MDFYIITQGCKVNQYESELMAELLTENGYHKAPDYTAAQVCIVNSCTVTATGDSKCRKIVHRIRRENPACIIVLCGCLPQAFSGQPEMFGDCDIVMGNTARRDIVAALDEFLLTRRPIVRIDRHENHEAFEPMTIRGFDERTRAYIKIEDGCNRFCTYCIIPYARGRVRSKPLDDLLIEAQTLARNGYKEIVLVGINLSAYGQELDVDLADAVCAVCSVDGVERVRLGSIEPEQMTRDILTRFAAQPKFCPHFHLSLQSGCDATLKRMRRHYDTAEYARIVSAIRELFENPAITTDVMVGFVGESEEEFEQSLDFCRRLGFAKAHVFPYSVRKGTAAEKMDGHIDEHVKHLRADRMIRATAERQRDFMRSQIGLTTSVLIERSSGGVSEGYTPNYTKVRIPDSDLPFGEVVAVRITEAFDDYCVGEVI